MDAICPICGKKFSSPKPCQFCSILCRNTNNGRQLKPKLLDCVCSICGKPYTTSPNPDGTPHNRYCSQKCGRKGAALTRRIPRVTSICPVCGKEFEHLPSRKSTYCSRECMGIAHSQMAARHKVVCEYCGKTFTLLNSSHDQRFCSYSCSGKATAQEQGLSIRKKTTFICQGCGKPFTRIARPERTYLYCCRDCFWQYHRGENHHCWQGGTDRYYGPNWDEQRARALERDNHTCQECGITEDGMNVHHIILRSEFGQDWEAMNDLSNLVTLCHSCHARIHIEHLNGP